MNDKKTYTMDDASGEAATAPSHEALAVTRATEPYSGNGELERTFTRLVETGFAMHREELQLTRDFGAGCVRLVEPLVEVLVRRIDADAQNDLARAARTRAEAAKSQAEANLINAEAEALLLKAQTERARNQG